MKSYLQILFICVFSAVAFMFFFGYFFFGMNVYMMAILAGIIFSVIVYVSMETEKRIEELEKRIGELEKINGSIK